MHVKPMRMALRISLGYALIAALWILFSDRALVALVSDPQVVGTLSTYKGWAFVAVTGFLLYGTLRTQLQRWQREVLGRVQTEEALRESEELYRVAIENSNDGIALSKEGRRLFVNRRFLEIFGYSREEALSMEKLCAGAPRRSGKDKRDHGETDEGGWGAVPLRIQGHEEGRHAT